jgi:DnaK suppressor protein
MGQSSWIEEVLFLMGKRNAQEKTGFLTEGSIAPKTDLFEADTTSSMRRGVNLANVELPEGYAPSEDEEFMNPRQLVFFRDKLLDWKRQILSEMKETLEQMPGTLSAADAIDVACGVMSQSIELRARDRERKLIHKIDEALQRIYEGTYGYCEETGEPISLKRLEARPVATLSIEAQERHEQKEREYCEEKV